MGSALLIRDSMKQPEDYPITLSTAMILLALTYILFAFACRVLFFPTVSSEITLDFPHTTLFEVMVAVGCINVIFTYPMVMYVVRIIIKGEYAFWKEHALCLDLLLFSAVILLAVYVDKF